MTITFQLQVGGSAFGHDPTAMLDICQRAEAERFGEIRVADHPGNTFDPFAILTAVAAATSQIRVGTYVLNMGVRDPLDVAIAANSVDRISGGRFTLGIGAGHTPAEWEARGLTRPDAGQRIDRLVECSAVLPSLLRGDATSIDGAHVQLHDAVVTQPTAVQTPIPILVGGSNRRLLRLAGETANIVGLTGMGPTLADGHRHQVRWDAADIERGMKIIRSAASGRNTMPTLDALVQGITFTDDPQSAATKVADRTPGLNVTAARSNPFLFFGSAASIAEQMQEFHDRWGISSYSVRPDVLDEAIAIKAILNS